MSSLCSFVLSGVGTVVQSASKLRLRRRVLTSTEWNDHFNKNLFALYVRYNMQWQVNSCFPAHGVHTTRAPELPASRAKFWPMGDEDFTRANALPYVWQNVFIKLFLRRYIVVTYICGTTVQRSFQHPINIQTGISHRYTYLPHNCSKVSWKRSLTGISSPLYFDLLFDMYILYPVIVYNKVLTYIHTF
jgi:hypothetical protein